MIYTTNNAQETQALAPVILQEVSKLPANQARVIAFEGELGAGKTTLIQALAKELGVTETLRSPTFVILKKYETKPRTSRYTLYAIRYTLIHMDCYRIRDEKDLEPLGFAENLADPQNLILIEWSERIQSALPTHRLIVHIDHIAENQRKIIIEIK